MMQISKELSELVRIRILKDMQPGIFTIYLKCGLAVLLGGSVSLFVCGQFGVGITHAALHFNNQLHAHVHDFGAALACGASFALTPPFILRLLCSSLQFRVMTRKSFDAALVWFVGLGTLLAHHGEMGTHILMFVLWSLAAIVTFMGLSRLIDRMAGNGSVSYAGNG